MTIICTLLVPLQLFFVKIHTLAKSLFKFKTMIKKEETKMEMLPVFVYGTLRQGEPNYDLYLQSKVIEAKKGYLEGALLYNFGPFPGVKLTDAKNRKVQGELMQLDPLRYEQIMADLDYLEDIKNNVYERIETQINLSESEEQLRAWVYIIGPELINECTDIIENGDWLTVSSK